MKSKKQFLVKLLIASFACCMITAAGAACGGDESESIDLGGDLSASETLEQSYDLVGEYYADSENGESFLTLGEGTFTLTIAGGESKNGYYVYSGSTLVMQLDDLSSAKATNGVITITYGGTTYKFLKKITYTVTYETNGGNAIEANSVWNGRTVAQPTAPEKTGVVFVGWYTNKAFTQGTLFNFNQPITANITLYARYVEPVTPEFTVNFDLGYEGGEAIAAQETVGGRLYDYTLPTPTREGYEFAGWWISDYNDATKLTSKYQEQLIEKDTTLFAVWKGDAPAVSVTESEISWTSVGTNANYKVTITDLATNKAVQETSTSKTSYSYNFAEKAAGEYSVTVSANGKTATAYYKNKVLAEVTVFEVKDGVLVFNTVANAEKYLLAVTCGTEKHDHTQVDLGASANYNFSDCDMLAEGIQFTVTAQANGYVSSTSTTFSFEQHLNAATGVTVSQELVTWDETENATSYRLVIKEDGVEKYNAVVTDRSYDLKGYAAGNITVEVTPIAKGYNSPEATQYTYDKTSIAAPSGLYVEDSYIVWTAVDGATGYEVKIGDRVVNATTNKIEFTEEYYVSGTTTYPVSVRALGGSEAQNSLYSETLNIQYGKMSDVLKYSANTVTWDPAFGINTYVVKVNEDGEEKRVEKANSCAVTLTKKGDNTIYVCALDGNGNKMEWVTLTVTAYALTFDATEGAEVETQYLATGDKIATLTDSTRVGYTFDGWYALPNAEGDVYEVGTTFKGTADTTIYAAWTANKYTVKLSVGGNASEALDEVQVEYNSMYTLPLPESGTSWRVFAGYYTEENGQGIKYTDHEGNSVNKWRGVDTLTLYAYWVDTITFTKLTDGGYSVSKGNGIGYVTEVTIPSTYNGEDVKIVQSFASCTNLKAIHIPDSIQTIDLGDNGVAFLGDKALESIDIYQTPGIKEVLYYSVDGVLFYYNKTNAEDAGNTMELVYVPLGKTGKYTIPDTITLYDEVNAETDEAEVVPVKKIVTGAFANTSISELEISANVTIIAKSAFAKATNLQKVTFLAAAEGVEEQTLTIGASAFSGCTALENITFPARVDSLSVDMFASCKALTSIDFVGEGGTYQSLDGILLQTTKTGLEIVYCPLANVCSYQAEDGEIQTGVYRIPTKVTSIGASAFSGYTALKKLIIPNWVTTIGQEAFKGCTGLTEIVFEGEADDVDLAILGSAFYGCSGLKSVTLPANLATLKTYAFGGNGSLTTVNVNCGGNENRTLNFEEGAFIATGTAKTSNVTTVILGENVPVLDVAGIFAGKKLSSVIVDENNPNYTSQNGILYDKEISTIIYYPMGKLGEYVVPETVKKIGTTVFYNRSGLTKITIGKNVEEIGSEAFRECRNLSEVVFVERTAEDAKLTIGDNAFYNCVSLTSLVLPVGTTDIGEKAFWNAANLASIVLPEGLKTIKSGAFGSTALTSITLPSTVESLDEIKTRTVGKITTIYYEVDVFGSSVSDNCRSLTEINVAEGSKYYASVDGVLYAKSKVETKTVTESEDENGETVTTETVTNVEYVISALAYCPYLKGGVIDVPETVTSIYDKAFLLNKNVTEIKFSNGLAPTIDPTTKKEVAGTLEIGQQAFYQCAKLEKVTLPNGVVSVGAYTFYQCYALTEIYIPNSVASLAQYAFYQCTGLTTLDFETVADEDLADATTLVLADGSSSGGGVFTGCTGLTEVTLPERTTEIGIAAFSGCTSLKTVKIPSTVETIGDYAFYGAPVSSISIPETSKLKTIAQYAFQSSLFTSIYLPEGLETIGQSSFQYSQLTSVHIPSTVKTFGLASFSGAPLTELIFADNSQLETITNSSFQGCNQLVKVDFGKNSSLKTLDNQAFRQCYSLEEITLPASIQEIGQRAFDADVSLKKVTFQTNADGKSNLQKIVTTAFKGTALTEFIFPESTSESITLGTEIFRGCKDLKKVYLSSSVTSIANVFDGCVSLETIEIAEDNQNFSANAPILYNANGNAVRYYYGKATSGDGKVTLNEGTLQIGDGAFYGRLDITEIYIPASVQTIGSKAFKNCINLKKVVFADESQLTSIGTYAFQNCTSLEEIAVPEGVTYLQNYTFDGCSSLAKVTLPSTLTHIGYNTSKPATLTSGYVFNNCTSLKEIELPEKLSMIHNFSFYGCSSLESISIPKSVATMGSSLFAYCSSLKKVEFDEAGSVTALGANTFQYCTSLTDVEFNNNAKIKTFGNYIFSGCTSLTHITLPTSLTFLGTFGFENSGLTSIDLSGLTGLTCFGSNASTCTASTAARTFQGCSALQSVTLPSKLTKIGGYTFYNCTSLTSINGADGLDLTGMAVVGTYAFAGCTSLTKISLAKSTAATYFGQHAFRDCTALTDITFAAGTTYLNSYMFMGCTGLKSVSLPNTLTSNLANTFQGCTSLESVDFNGNTKMTALGNYMFQGCTSLKTIALPTSLTSSGTYAFDGCTSLTSVTLPASLKTIAQYAFNGCTSLTSITLPSSLTTIQKNAFYGSGLTDVSLPKTTTSIAIGAFGACNSLESFTVASGNTAYKAEDGVLYTLDGTIVCYPTAKKVEGGVLTITEDQSIGDGAFMGCLYIDEVVLPDGIEIIPQYAFYGSSIKKIDLPASLTEIKTYAFAQSALESVVIPETVEYIGSYAFAGSALKEAEILTTSSYASYSVLTSGAINYSYHAFTFSGCEQLEKVTFTEGIDRIGANMFEYCTSLKSFTIPASVTLVDSYAFRYSGLTSITIPETITKLGTSSFAGSALEEVEILTTNIMGTNNVAGATSGAPTAVFSDCQSLRSVKIPEGTIIIGASMFLNCTSLGSISLPSTLTNIYTSAFKGSGLKSIVIPDSVRTAADTITYGVAISAFEDCKSLETVTLSANMDRIVASTFSGCTALKTIVIPASIQDICSYAFKDCISLQNLIIPRTATSVGFSVTSSNVFEGMTEEQTIYFESSELEINAWWTFGWNAGCNAKIVFDYSADEQE